MRKLREDVRAISRFGIQRPPSVLKACRYHMDTQRKEGHEFGNRHGRLVEVEIAYSADSERVVA